MWIKCQGGWLVNLNHALSIFLIAPTKYQTNHRVSCEIPSSGQIDFECDTNPNTYVLFQGEKSMCEKYLKEIEELLGIYE